MSHYTPIGIIGGVGPIATADFYTKLLHQVNAQSDFEYPRVVIDSDPRIPDRTLAVFGHGPDPTSQLIDVGKRLEVNGVGVIGIPCNTAHAFYERVQAALTVPVVNMVAETARAIRMQYPAACHVGILATSGTRHSRVYDDTLTEFGLKPIHVSPTTQRECVMEAIYGVNGLKAGYHEEPRRQLLTACGEIADAADVVVAGCTEIPIVLSNQEIGVPLIDSSVVLARSLLTHTIDGTVVDTNIAEAYDTSLSR